MLDDGLINKAELIEICSNLHKSKCTKSPEDLEDTFKRNLRPLLRLRQGHYEKLPLNSTIPLLILVVYSPFFCSTKYNQ
jgi:hypothetical protein